MITIKYEMIRFGEATWDQLVKYGSYTMVSVAKEGAASGFVSGTHVTTGVAVVVPWHRVIEIHEGGEASQD